MKTYVFYIIKSGPNAKSPCPEHRAMNDSRLGFWTGLQSHISPVHQSKIPSWTGLAHVFWINFTVDPTQ